MFDLSLGEMALTAGVAAIFIGPKELPVVIRAIMKIFRQLSDLAHELKQGFVDLAKEPGYVDLEEEMEGTKRYIKDLEGHWRETYDLQDVLPSKLHTGGVEEKITAPEKSGGAP